MEIYQVDFNRHIRSAWIIILAIIICTNFPVIFSFLYPKQSYTESVFIGITVFIVFVLPAAVIHINYYLVNKGDILKYYPDERKVTLIHKGVSNTFGLDDIDYVKRSISFNEEAHRSSVVPWDGYNHTVIYLKDGQSFTITSLLIPDLEFPIEKEKIIIKRNVYRLAKIR